MFTSDKQHYTSFLGTCITRSRDWILLHILHTGMYYNYAKILWLLK